ncbi:bifunctional glycosyltransferase family 2/GtrA family protein [Brachybacterium sp.]|uniref:bifunctional glycosyltransferase family 2/GtrA family protein n=1 Tax=Brachybacterium sp. TaxID=1891286 RepID=UPI002ED38E2B
MTTIRPESTLGHAAQPAALPVRSLPTATSRAVVLIPALDPGAELEPLVAGLIDDDIAMLVVDDGSGPRFRGVFDRCELLGAEVLHLEENVGKGGALRTGLDHVRRSRPGCGVVTADADGQHTPADIRKVRDVLDGLDGTEAEGAPAASGHAIVLGVRGFDQDVPLRSRAGNLASSWVLRLAAGARLRDTQTGLRGLPAERLGWAMEIPGDRYEYEYGMLVRAGREGIGLHQVPISTVYLDQNAASHFRPVRDSLRVLAPVLAFSLSGLLAVALDTAVFLLLAGVGSPLWLALSVARVLSASGNFAMNRAFVFPGGRSSHPVRAAAAYAVLAVIVLGAGVLLVNALHGLGIPLLVAKTVTDLVLFTLSYAVQRMVVFRAR